MSSISWVAAPLLIPLVGGFFCILFWKNIAAQKAISLLTSSAMLLASVKLLYDVLGSGTLVHQAGSWRAPFGISLVADTTAALMLFGTALVAFCNALYCLDAVTTERKRFGFFPLLYFLFLGVNGAFLTGDLFNLYVWFEVLLISSFGLMTLGGDRKQLKGGFSYVLISMLSSAFFLAGLGLLYGLVGSLNMADVAQKIAESPAREQALPAIALLFVGFAIKSGVFPLFSWLPLSYHTPLPVVSAVFGGLLTKVGVYAMLRLFATVYPISGSIFQPLLIVISVLTMVVGVLAAAAQYDIRKILSVHIVSQVGYMTLAIAFATELGYAAVVFFLLHQMIVKTNLFYVAGAIERMWGTGSLKKLGGHYKNFPLLSALFMVSALALAGLPPLSGFVAKLLVLKAGFSVGAYWATGAAIGVSLLTLYSMIKIWIFAFWKPLAASALAIKKPISYGMYACMILLAFMALFVGALAGDWVDGSSRAGFELLDRTEYIVRVLQEGVAARD